MKWDRWMPALAVIVAVVGAVVWQNREGIPAKRNVQLDDLGLGSVQPSPERWLHCQDLSGEPVDRLSRCLAELPSPKLSAGVEASLKTLAKGGTLLSAGPSLGLAGAEQQLLAEQTELLGPLMGNDEGAASKALRGAGIRGLVVHRDLQGALDRDDAILARLVYRDHYEWFQLRYATSELLVYSVRTSPTHLPLATGEGLLQGLRARLEGVSAKEMPRQRWTPGAVRLLGSIRKQGAMLALRHVVVGSDGNDSARILETALDELASKLRREWERDVEPEGHGRLDDQLDQVRIEIQVVMERAPVEPRTRYDVFSLWEMGVDGMMFRQRPPKSGEKLDEKFTYMPGSELTTRSMHSPDEFLQYAVKEFGWSDRRPWEKDPRTRLDLIRTQHFIETDLGGGPAVRLVRGMPEVPLDAITGRRVQDMLIAGGEWWLENLHEDKSFEYKYWPTQNRRSEDYNEVRHILAARDLADTWRYRHDPRYLDGSRAAMDWLLRYQVHDTEPAQGPLPHAPAGTMLFRYPSYVEQRLRNKPANQKLGTVAVALLGWVAWAQSTGSHAEDERIRKMAKFTTFMQEADGRFKPYLVHSGHAYQNERNDIVPGEAALALGMVAEYFDELEWLDGYPKFIEYYQPWFQSRAERVRPTGRWPHAIYVNRDRLDLVQFGPWSVMAANQYTKLTGDLKAAEFGLEVADWMIDKYQWQGDKSPWPDYIGGYYKLPNETPAMQTFCYSEGTAAAYAMAARHYPDRKGKYELATRESIRFLEVMQFDMGDSYFIARPEMVRGGIKYTMNENKVRIDYVGHGLSTLSQYLDAIHSDPDVTLDIFDPDDLERAAGTFGSVPGLNYSAVEPPAEGGAASSVEAPVLAPAPAVEAPAPVEPAPEAAARVPAPVEAPAPAPAPAPH